jgi:hypothetical protein
MELNRTLFENTGQVYEGTSQAFRDTASILNATTVDRNLRARSLSNFGFDTNNRAGLQEFLTQSIDPNFVDEYLTKNPNIDMDSFNRIKSDIQALLQEDLRIAQLSGQTLESTLLRQSEGYKKDRTLNSIMENLPSIQPLFERITDRISNRIDFDMRLYQSAIGKVYDNKGSLETLTSQEKEAYFNAPERMKNLTQLRQDREIVQSIRNGFMEGGKNFLIGLQKGQGLKAGGALIRGIGDLYQNAVAESLARKFIQPMLDKIPGFSKANRVESLTDKMTKEYLPKLESIDKTLKEIQSGDKVSNVTEDGIVIGRNGEKITAIPGTLEAITAAGISTAAIKEAVKGIGPVAEQTPIMNPDGSPYVLNPIQVQQKKEQDKKKRKSGFTKAGEAITRGIGYYSAAKSAYDAGATGGPLAGALGGAMTGSAFGPVGTIVGGLVGLFGGLFGKRHAPKDPKDYDNFWTPKDVMWATPGYRPFSAYAGGRSLSMAGAPITVDINLKVSGMNPNSYNDAIQKGVREGVTDAVSRSYARERQLGNKR